MQNPRLSEFLRVHADEILLAWDEFAATVSHEGKALDAVALRDHAAEILKTIAADLAQPQSPAQQDAKSKGLGPRHHLPTPAETHADFRMVAGFAVDAMITESATDPVALTLRLMLAASDGRPADALPALHAAGSAAPDSSRACSA